MERRMKIINAKVVKKSLEEEFILSQQKTKDEWNKIYMKFDELLRQKKWIKAYDVYVEFIEKYNIINYAVFFFCVYIVLYIK